MTRIGNGVPQWIKLGVFWGVDELPTQIYYSTVYEYYTYNTAYRKMYTIFYIYINIRK
jgi:hypothetical protein